MIGTNWNLKYRLAIKELEKVKLQKEILERRLSKYEDHNLGTTRNRKNNNTIKFG